MRSVLRAALAAFAFLSALVPVAHAQSTDTGYLSTVKLYVALPYGLMDEHPGGLRLAIESERVPGAITEQLPEGFLKAHLRQMTPGGGPDARPTNDFVLKSWVADFSSTTQEELRSEKGSNRFESPWVVVLADPRASIKWLPAVADLPAVGCNSCKRPPLVEGKTEAEGVFEVWSHGRTMVMRPEDITGSYSYLEDRKRLHQRLPTVIADTVRVADKVLPSKQVPPYGSQVVHNVVMHSGELVREALDLTISGRGMDFNLQRYYSSAVYSFGPLGRNFDSPLFARAHFLPEGELAFYDGTGRVHRFYSDMTPYPGVFLRATNTQAGIVISWPDHTTYYFDNYGRLSKITDRNTTMPDGSDGNMMTFSYNAEGRLGTVVDPVGRKITFAYYTPTAAASGGTYPGLLSTVTDFDGRVVSYEYDAYGRLTKVTGPDPASSRSEQQVTKYVWGPAPTTGNFRTNVLQSGQITSEVDGEGRTIFTAAYSSTDAWRVESMSLGGGTWTYAWTDMAMTVTDPNAHATKYSYDDAGRVTSMEEPGGAITQYAFDDEGRLTAVVRPMGSLATLTDAVTYTYAPGGGRDKRAMGNLTSITERPLGGSAADIAGETRTTTIGYGPRNLPTSYTSPDGRSMTIARDERGNPQSLTANGITTTFEYDSRGQLKKVIDPRAGTSTFTYETTDALKKGYLKSVAASSGTTNFTIDNRGNVLTMTRTGGATSTFVVNKLDQIEEESTPNAKVMTSFDGVGSLKARQILAGVDPTTGAPVFSTSTFVIDELGRTKTRTENGRATSYGYDPAGNLISVTAAGLPPKTFGYDARDRLTSVTEGGQTTIHGYDLDGRETSTINPRGKTTTYITDGFGNRIGEQRPIGVSIVRTLDRAGRPLDVRTVKRVSDTEAYVLQWTQFAYDGAGRQVREIRKRFNAPLRIPATGDPEGATDVITQTVYDDAANKVSRIDPRGNATVTQLDGSGRAFRVTDAAGNVIEYTYDENGNPRDEKRIEKRPDGTTETFTTRTAYDADNRLVMVVDMNENRARTFLYDSAGNRTEETDPAGRTTKFAYDLRGNMVKQTDPEGGVTEYRHDDANRIEWMKDPNGNETNYRYDDDGNLLSETRMDGASWSYTYDAHGNVKTVTDPNGTVVTNTYDDGDRLVLREIANGAAARGPSRISYGYDDLGRMTAAETDLGAKSTFAYDSIGNLLSEGIQIGSGPARTVGNGHDPAGNVITRTYPSGLSLSQTFSAIDLLASISQGGSPLVTYRDAGSRLVSRVLATGIEQTRTYDASARLERIEDRRGNDVLRDTGYSWSPAGEKLKTTRTDLSKQWSFGRNGNGWITSEVVERTDTDTNNLLRSTTYQIDDALNFRKISRTTQSGGASSGTIDTVVNRRNQYTSFGGENLTWDRNGNLQTYRGAQLRYDYENRLTRATLADGTVIDHLYDAKGRKVSTTITPTSGAARTTAYVHAGDEVIEEYTDGKLAMRYVRGRDADEIVRAERSSAFDGNLDQLLFPLQDELANVDRLTDASGNTLERYEYTGYGELRIFSSTSFEQSASAYGWKWLFQGREYDRATGGYDFRSRTLWPELGRFGQEDSIHEGPMMMDTPNLYQALRLDFAGKTDPDGTWTVDVSDPISGWTLKHAIQKARQLYKAFNLGPVYKQINKKYDGGTFLQMQKPPTLALGLCTRGNLTTTLEDRVLVCPAFWNMGFTHPGNGAFATLTTGLLHEQGHVEAIKSGITDEPNGITDAWAKEKIGMPTLDHQGYKTDMAMMGGAIHLFLPSHGSTNLFSGKAAENFRSNQKQIQDIMAGSKFLRQWFQTTNPTHGIVFDHQKQKAFVIDPVTGKIIKGATVG